MRPHTDFFRSLLLSSCVFSSVAYGQTEMGQVPTEEAGGPARTARSVINSWNMTAALNYSDNFAFVPEGPIERRFQLPDGSFVAVPVVVTGDDGTQSTQVEILSDTFDIENQGKTFSTLSFAGSTVVRRPRLTGLVQGQMVIGHYFNDDTLSDIYANEIRSNPPEEAALLGAEGTIGNPGIQETFFDPNISGFGAYEVIDDRFYFEAGGFLQQQALNVGGQLQAQSVGQDINTALLAGVFLSPVYTRDFRNQQQVELRYRNSSVTVIDEVITNEALVNENQIINDSISHEGIFNYVTGNTFGPLAFGVSGLARWFEEDSGAGSTDQEVEQLSGSFSTTYAVNDVFDLEGVIGYDDVEIISTNPDDLVEQGGFEEQITDLSGLFYSAGFTYRPSRASQFSLSVGERYQGTQINARAELKLTNRIRFNASAERRLTSGAQEQQLGTLNQNIQSLNLIQRLSRQSEGLSEQTINQLVQTQGGGLGQITLNQFAINAATVLRAGLSANFGRTSIELRGNANLIDDTPEGQEVVGQQGEQYGAGAAVRRRLNRRWDASLTGNFIINDGFGGGAGTDQKITQASVGLNTQYVLRRNMAVTGSFQHLRRDLETPPEVTSFFTGQIFEFQENQVSVGVRWTF